jgi:Zn-dependent protease
MEIGEILRTASVWVIPVLLAITLHEAAHGWAAWRLGDNTAYMLGRVSFNPFRHIDLFGTIVLPAILIFTRAPFLFGWAKPVPVRFGALKYPRRDMVLVAAAGPATNLILAILSALLIHAVFLVPDDFGKWLQLNLLNSLWLNLVLAVFNMLPIPPLDGGRVLVGLLPEPFSSWLAGVERFGMFILVGLLIVAPMLARQTGGEFNIFAWLVGEPVALLRDWILVVTGHR